MTKELISILMLVSVISIGFIIEIIVNQCLEDIDGLHGTVKEKDSEIMAKVGK